MNRGGESREGHYLHHRRHTRRASPTTAGQGQCEIHACPWNAAAARGLTEEALFTPGFALLMVHRPTRTIRGVFHAHSQALRRRVVRYVLARVWRLRQRRTRREI